MRHHLATAARFAILLPCAFLGALCLGVYIAWGMARDGSLISDALDQS